MSSNSSFAVTLSSVYKAFPQQQQHSLKQLVNLLLSRRTSNSEVFALTDISFSIKKGEVFGVVGRNGAGKTTLLQIISGIMQPSDGEVLIQGRVSALLELGSGFNPDFTGRENIFLYANILGLSNKEINLKLREIISFSGLESYIDQPLNTYSSGMIIRLAFSVATSIEPDILIIDEALSVGDGDFSYKSLNRIKELKNKGVTIIFCTHSLFQVEAFCDRAIWIEHGQCMALGHAQAIVGEYNSFLIKLSNNNTTHQNLNKSIESKEVISARLIKAAIRGLEESKVPVFKTGDDINLYFEFFSHNSFPTPSLAFTLLTDSGITIASAGTFNDGIYLNRDDKGLTRVSLCLNNIPLLKGKYAISLFLLSVDGLMVYDHQPFAVEFVIEQSDLQQGIFSINHSWSCDD